MTVSVSNNAYSSTASNSYVTVTTGTITYPYIVSVPYFVDYDLNKSQNNDFKNFIRLFGMKIIGCTKTQSGIRIICKLGKKKFFIDFNYGIISILDSEENIIDTIGV